MTRYYVRGYVNNPRWDAPATGEHKPCGYWYQNDVVAAETIETITQGSGWEEVAPPIHVPGEVSKECSIAIWDDTLYCLYGHILYKWNGVDNWDLVLNDTSTQDFDREAMLITHNNQLWRLSIRFASPFTRRLYKITPGDASWSYVSEFASTTYAANLGSFGSTLYVTSSNYGRVYTQTGTFIASHNSWPVGLMHIPGPSTPFFGGYGAYSGQQLYELVGGTLVQHGIPWSGNRTAYPTAWAYSNGVIFHHSSTGLVMPFRLSGWTRDLGWTDYPVFANVQGHLVDWDGSLHGVTIGETTLNTLRGFNAETGVWQTLADNMPMSGPTRNGAVVVHNLTDFRTLYAVQADGKLLRFMQTVHRRAEGFTGFDSPDDSVWPLPNFP